MFKRNGMLIEINKRHVCDKLWMQYLYYEHKEFEVRQLVFGENNPFVKSKLEQLVTGYKEAKENAFALSIRIDWVYTAGNMLTFSR